MPKTVNIPADAEPQVDPSIDDLESQLAKARADKDKLRKARGKVRQETPKPKLAAVLAETDDAYVAAIDLENQLERKISRLKGRLERKVKVGSASSKATATGTGGN